jgi:hypothetical protein
MPDEGAVRSPLCPYYFLDNFLQLMLVFYGFGLN